LKRMFDFGFALGRRVSLLGKQVSIFMCLVGALAVAGKSLNVGKRRILMRRRHRESRHARARRWSTATRRLRERHVGAPQNHSANQNATQPASAHETRLPLQIEKTQKIAFLQSTVRVNGCIRSRKIAECPCHFGASTRTALRRTREKNPRLHLEMREFQSENPNSEKKTAHI
jgi:hypothetical protein